MSGWEDLEQSKNKEIKDNQQIIDDHNRLVLRVFKDEDGVKLLNWLKQVYLDQPVAIPGSDSSHAYYREGQNSVVRDIFNRIAKARKL